MGPAKIVRMVATAAAVGFAFWTTFEYATLLMVILGLGIGYVVEADRRTRYLVTVVALSVAGGGLGAIPAAGEYITAIFGNVSTIINAGALVMIGTGIYEKVME